MITSILFYIIGGVALGCAWHFPGTYLSSILGFISLTFLLIPFRLFNKQSCWSFYLYGIVANLIGFHWLVYTIENFGGYNSTLSVLIFILFVLTHSLQFPLYAFIVKKLSFSSYNIKYLLPAFAWITSCFIAIRIFPWDFAHTQIALTSFVQIADIAGSFFVTFMMFIIAEIIINIVKARKIKRCVLSLILIILIINIYGFVKIAKYSNIKDGKINVSLIQADIRIHEKNNVKYLAANTIKYYELSKETILNHKPDLVIWPESAITNFVNIPATDIETTNFLPYQKTTNFLVGALSKNQNNIYNSTFGILKNKKILRPYHKQILMPFGEYMPLSETFPFLNDLNPNIASFTAGKNIEVFEFDNNLNLAPLICYEDIIPSISREAVNKGAKLLVNLTNDAWFGNTIAGAQHNLIASFRAIENKRYLLRSTNTGLTAIINPLGKIEAKSPVFSQSILNHNIFLLSDKTLYTSYIGNKLWWLITFITIMLLILIRKSKNEKN